ncbi:translation initiation factor [Antrihabitans sp. YC3-6]|uniref:Translation initiation factor n=1 Tax=Antrihabitans stalagmiti TaxID=2799499 RepID=A0A934NWN0_9NOCA|nr:DUF6319 family protein [Antrihabitans stalagmiti]MBJ8342619.1 translation initiation factor [Antrihabitans stalagmiti]
MPPRRRSAADVPLSQEDLATLGAAISAGERATVYLREPTPSLGLEAGASAKVVRISGTTVTVRPRGVDDELPFEADELRMTRRTAAEDAPAAPAKPVSRRRSPKVDTAPVGQQAPVDTTPRFAPTPAAPAPVATPAKTPSRSARGPKKVQDGVTVTIHGTLDNSWTVSVAYGSRPPGKAAPVRPDAVERAMAELDDAAARDAIDTMLSTAREAVANRIADLNRQLEEARHALAELGSTGEKL